MTASLFIPTDDGASHMVSRRANRLLGALSARDFEVLAPHLEKIDLPRGRVLFEPGDDVTTTYFPCFRTMASLLIATRDGREVEAATIGREGAIGGIVSEGNKPAFGRAVVQIGGEALAIPTSHLEAAKIGSPRFGDLFSRYADSLLAQMMQSVACNALHNAEERACRWLLATHDRAGDKTIQLTQEALAEMLGLQRTTVTGVTTALQARGLIRNFRGGVEVIDREGLERAACECYRAVEDHFARLLPEVDV
ncbi:Crp/Fnr family transcriptional regulator [Phenylobacterium sp.]|uniref:Crp/Fnr family transcriptional regulator n=1 Tax=Phenylobacterium sp. TaxID=1871053 RepID=UPI0025D7CA7D|nr:Crp/Fnr family transcriptional regulator [Phenylobacterium sp.]MBX3483946.1 Crp/Fnr family transcriptional regulator [Phenylobacterium sp.]MCW5759317.1 Crp/Fnr family transcriptional regulator [Phenylobacterium sp.]